MGFTFILLLAYLALTGLAVIAFRSGRKALGGGVLAVMAVSIAVLDTCGSRLPCDGGELWRSDSLPMRRKNRP